jgi:hypothetical protein
MMAACRVVRAHGADRVVVAVPVAPDEALARIAEVADEVVCLRTPRPFFSVGQWYRDFSQTTDTEVTMLLAQARERDRRGTGTAPPVRNEELSVLTATGRLAGHLTVPADARGLVVFAHGSGSSRHSPRNRFVARALNEAGFGTFLLDLLTPAEEETRASVFDVERLATRLAAVTRAWCTCRSATSARAPGPRRPWSRRPSPAYGSARSCRAADGPTSPATGWAWCTPRPC